MYVEETVVKEEEITKEELMEQDPLKVAGTPVNKAKHKGIRYPCDQCDISATTSSNLNAHKKAKHLGIRFPCDKCEYLIRCNCRSIWNINMEDTSANKKRKIDGDTEVNTKAKKVYSCDQCEYTATQHGHLKTHKQAKHEGIRYPCDQCEYAATHLANLKRHIESKHEGIRYSCDQCEYVATNLRNLRKHKKSIHKEISANLNSHTKAKDSKEMEEQNVSSLLRRKLNVRLEKLDYSEYLRTQDQVKCVETSLSETFQIEGTESVFVDMVPTFLFPETEVKQENVTTDDPLEILRVDNILAL